jgi:hypothetical protein
MDPKLFKQRLEELAELKTVRAPRSPAQRAAEEPEEIFRNGKTLVIDEKNNPTNMLAIKKIRNQEQICEDCDRFVKNRVVNYKVLDSPQRHWRKSCGSCQKTFNPETGQFDLISTKAGYVYACFFNKEKQSISRVIFKKPTK